jgi:2'-5' RNA ligase
VIVAIPSESDPVRQYSSEKEPHLTLLYLGKPSVSDQELQHVVDYTEHAASSCYPFYLDVDHRGVLGDDEADVLFFNKKEALFLNVFRNHLLQDPVIFRLYNSIRQFPEWTPHLTMGYPSSPAKKNPNEYYDFSSVKFDRIAVWTGDYEGPTFRLKPSDSEALMSQFSREQNAAGGNLVHYGVKGMHWGAHKNSAPTGRGSEDTRTIESHNKKIQKGGTRELNTKELREVVERMKLEIQYSQMTAQKSTVERGHDQVKKILALAQTAQTIYSIANGPLVKNISKALNERQTGDVKIPAGFNSPSAKIHVIKNLAGAAAGSARRRR